MNVTLASEVAGRLSANRGKFVPGPFVVACSGTG